MANFLKKDRSRIRIITDPDMHLMVEERTKGGSFQAILRYVNNKYMKNYDKDIESFYLAFLDANNLYGCPMCDKHLVNGFEWVEELPQFNEDFIKTYDKNSDKGYFLKFDVSYPKKLFNSHKDFSYLPEREKI